MKTKLPFNSFRVLNMKKTFSKKYMFVLGALIASAFAVNNAYSQTLMYNQGFESTADSWGKSSMSTSGFTTNRTRTGASCFYMVSTTSKGYSTYATNFTTGTYIHAIAWVASTNASQQLYFSLNNVSGDAMSVSKTYSRLTFKTGGTAGYNYTGSTGSKNLRIYLNVTPTSGDSIYADDVVLYYTTTNVPTDLVKPDSPSSATGTTSTISWTNGTDGTGTEATGVQASLIFARTAGTVGGNDLTLNDQGQYPASSVLGNWTLLGSVASTATSYTGTFTLGNEYAIVHRDLAYNYSAPTYVVVSVSGVENSTSKAAKVYAANKTVTVEGNAGAKVSVVSLDGITLYSGVITSTKETLPVSLQTGVYAVVVNGVATKVFVK